MAKMTLDELVEQLRAAFGGGLCAVVLYGSTTAGEVLGRWSDHNVLVIVDALDLELLQREAAIARAWMEGGNPPLLTLTLEEWRGSGDIFPMEYADILDRHRVLYGTPPFDGITVDRKDLRLQLEFQAMGKLLQLRQGVLAAGGERRRLLDLLSASLSTFMVLFRSLLRYHGDAPSADYEELSRQVAARSGVSADPFMRVVRHVRGAEKIADADIQTVLAAYLAGARQLVHHIDQLGAT